MSDGTYYASDVIRFVDEPLHTGDAPRRDEGTAEARVPCEVYSRIVGYLTNIGGWNVGKQQEFEDRRVFDVSEVLGD